MSFAPSPNRTAYRPGPFWASALAAALTWPLLLVGGTVTVYRVGMAVPDWPTTFGVNMFLYRFWVNTPWGVQVEHTHRLAGAAVGLACIVLAGLFLAREPRRWLKALGVLTLAAVIGQGVLGGLRVNRNSPTLAFVHGCTAEAFFALTVALTVFTGRRWIEAEPRRPDPAGLRFLAPLVLALVSGQIVAGALLRHFGAAFAVHATLGGIVAVLAALLLGLVEGRRAEAPGLVGPARGLVLAVGLQVALGLAAWWALRPFDGIARRVWPGQALVRLGHQGIGALALAAAVVLSLRAWRHLGPAVQGEWTSAEPVVRGLEAIA